ncbi:hypothetical protein Y032_0003g1524 [Ancylostoma ceylanicum]|uniref:Uncharacterized protein n=2 Tax=Ancylostoma ceylanicum TaxID=53326 RepID=A0A016VZ70_9BILA|nr:hypothetical protein Y032_0003g1524 [Ancylostoma ceylanicum]
MRRVIFDEKGCHGGRTSMGRYPRNSKFSGFFSSHQAVRLGSSNRERGQQQAPSRFFRSEPAFTEPTRIKLSTLVEERRMAENQNRIRCNGSVVPINVSASEEEKKQLCAFDRRFYSGG